MYFCVGGSGCLLFLRLLKLTNFTCSSSNSVDLIKSCIFIFIELKVKGVVCLSVVVLLLLLLLLFCESKVGKKFRFTKLVHAASAMVDRMLQLKTSHIVSHFQFVIIFFNK